MCKVFLYVIKLYKSKHEKSYDYKYQFPNFTNNILISKFFYQLSNRRYSNRIEIAFNHFDVH